MCRKFSKTFLIVRKKLIFIFYNLLMNYLLSDVFVKTVLAQSLFFTNGPCDTIIQLQNMIQLVILYHLLCSGALGLLGIYVRF